MSEHVWRQGHGISPLREWIRRDLPGGNDGFVVEDIDIVVRRFGKDRSLDDDIGDLMIVETKEFNGASTYGQTKVYEIMSRAMDTSAMPYAEFWRGAYVLRIQYASTGECCPMCGFPILTPEDAYRRFLDATLYWDNVKIDIKTLKRKLDPATR